MTFKNAARLPHSLSLPTFDGVRRVHYSLAPVFRVATALGDVFLYVSGGYPSDSNCAVVEVDAVRFLKVWRHPRSSHSDVAHRTVTGWRQDSKYASIDDAFQRSEVCPLPLPELGLSSRTEPCIGFTDGVTRTLWLLANGARAFPVICSLPEAAAIYMMAGTPTSRVLPVAQLIPRAEPAA
jgi:hypothetical protein